MPTPAPPKPSSDSSDSETPQHEYSSVGNHDCADAGPIGSSAPPPHTHHLHDLVIRSDATRGREGRELAGRVRPRPASAAHDPEERLGGRPGTLQQAGLVRTAPTGTVGAHQVMRLDAASPEQGPQFVV